MKILSGLYGRAMLLRRAWYAAQADRRRRLGRPVISVGNLVLGGSGKTPVVARLARLLAEAGERPAILSRGYGRRRAADGVVVVSDAERVLATPEESGDEPYMLARSLPGVPVLVSSDRHLAGRLAERRLGCTLHLLDDGFQHVRLERDVDLLVMSVADLEAQLLPFGRLREPLSAAHAADALLVAGGEADVETVAGRIGVAQAFRVAPRYGTPRYVAGDRSASGDGPRRALAVAGIARPERFVRALRALGWQIVGEKVFRDHHWFTSRDVAAIERAAAESGAEVVMTTEKDAVRCAGARLGRAIPWLYLPLDVTVEPADAFAPWLAGRLAAARRRLSLAGSGGDGDGVAA